MPKKYLFFIFLLLLFVALTSGYIYFFTPGFRAEEAAEVQEKSLAPAVDEKKTEAEEVLGGSAALLSKTPPAVRKKISSGSPQVEPPEINKQDNTVVINGERIKTSVAAGASVYDLMKRLAAEGKLRFSGTNYSGLGFFIEEINGVKNDARENKFWLYYVNGKEASVGISGYTLTPDDVVEWKFDKLN